MYLRGGLLMSHWRIIFEAIRAGIIIGIVVGVILVIPLFFAYCILVSQ